MDRTSLTRLGQAQRGEPEPLEKFVKPYHPFIRRQIQRLLFNGDAADVDDVTQEVCVVLLKKLPTFERRHEGSFRAFLRKIARLQVLAFLKKRRGKNGGTGDDDQFMSVEQLADPRSDLSRLWDVEHRRFVSDQVRAEVLRHAGERDFRIYIEAVVNERKRNEVAQEFEVGVATVFRAIGRVAEIVMVVRGEWEDILDD